MQRARLSRDELRGRMVGKPTRIAEMMRLRLSDTATSAVLAEHHRMQAMGCQQMALITLSPFRDVWLDLAAKWTKLAQEQEAEEKPH